MALDPTRRIANWDAKYNTERIKAVLDAKREAMFSRVVAVFPELASMETQTKQVLDQIGVSMIQYPFYLDFARELWRMADHEVSGESAAKEAATLIGKWVSRGLNQSTLESIRTGVFNISAPVPGP